MRWGTLAVSMFVLGCAPRAAVPARSDGLRLNAGGVRDRAAFDFGCPKDQVTVEDLDGRNLSFGATGCGKRAAYVWKRSTVVLNSPIQEAASAPSQDSTQESR